MFKSKEEYIGVGILLLLVIFSVFNKQKDEAKLEEEGIFVLGVFESKAFNAESGWVYHYKYYYSGKAFYRNFNSKQTEQMKSDSLLFFRILPTSPEVCRELEDIKVPKCIRINDVPQNGWRALPEDTCK